MTAKGTHECPAKNCSRQVAAHMLMCKPDWYRVPAALRSEVWDTWAGGLGEGTQAHCDAMLAAVEAVNA